ncbi:MAG: hypothetical protein WCJ35_11835 [Planctomycetota bacterium]
MASMAGNGTGRTERAAAVLAAVMIVFIQGVAAFLAHRAIPAGDFDISTALAVGVQYLGDQREEVVEPAVG